MRISPISNNNYKQSFGSLIIKDDAAIVLDEMSLDQLQDVKKWANELENTKEFDLVVKRDSTDLFIKHAHKTNSIEDSEGPLHYVKGTNGKNAIVAGIDLLDSGDWFYYDLKFKNKEQAQEVQFNLKKLEENQIENDTVYNLIKWAVQGIKYLEEGYGHDIEKTIANSQDKKAPDSVIDLLIAKKEVENKHDCTVVIEDINDEKTIEDKTTYVKKTDIVDTTSKVDSFVDKLLAKFGLQRIKK